MRFVHLLKAVVVAIVVTFAGTPGGVLSIGGVEAVSAAVVNRIDVRGNQRLEDEVVTSYLTISAGQRFNNSDIDDSIKALFATGLFGDVSIYQQGSVLVVEVSENATINKIFFDGNSRLKDDALKAAVGLKERNIFSDEQASSDVDRIDSAYAPCWTARCYRKL